MSETIYNYIDTYGGKNGPLLFLRKYYPDLRPHIWPFSLKNMSELRDILIKSKGSKTLFQKITQEFLGLDPIPRQLFGKDPLRADIHVKDILLRISHPEDWRSMVDFLPTKTIASEDWSNGNYKIIINEVIEEVFEKLGSKEFKKATANFVRKIPHKLFTITEDSNSEDVCYVDSKMPGDRSREERTFMNGMLRNESPMTGSSGNKVHIAKDFYDTLKGLTIFKKNERLQFEIGLDSKTNFPYLFQAKQFCDLFKPHSLDIMNMIQSSYHGMSQRIMGNVPKNGEKILAFQIHSLSSVPGIVEDIQDRNFMLYADEGLLGSLENKRPKNLVGFASNINRALNHNLTEITKAVLHNNGFCILGYASHSFLEKDLRDSEVVIEYTSKGLRINNI